MQYGTKSIECVRQPTSEFEGKIDLGDFIKTVDADHYFTYPGSLTTPGCEEAVIWTVFPRIITIDNDQVTFMFHTCSTELNKVGVTMYWYFYAKYISRFAHIFTLFTD